MVCKLQPSLKCCANKTENLTYFVFGLKFSASRQMFEFSKANNAHASVRRNIGHASYFLVLAFSFVSRIRQQKCRTDKDW